MFEEIRLQPMSFSAPVDAGSAELHLKEQGVFDVAARFWSESGGGEDELDFALEGRAGCLFPAPQAPELRERLLHIDVFALVDAGPDYFTRRQDYPSYLLCCTYDGAAELIYDGCPHALTPGTGFFIDCRRPHAYHTVGEHWLHAILHLGGHNADLLFERFLDDGCPLFADAARERYQKTLEAALLAEQERGRLHEFEVSALLERLLLDIIDDKYRDAPPPPDYVLQVRAYLEEHFSERLTLDGLAARACVSKYHLSREFKRHVGMGINEYLIALRLDRACYLLQSSELPAGAVAERCGFANYSNFYRLFKARMGTSPQAYRATAH